MLNWKRLLSTPVPASGLIVTRSVVGGLRLSRKGLQACTVRPLSPGAVEVGPVGLQGVDRAALSQALGPVLEALRGARRPVVVLPTSWVRAHILEFDELPRRSSEWDDLVRWRLKKLLPVRPTDLRISINPLAPRNGRRTLLTVSCLERALADLEGVLGELEAHPAVISPRLFGLSRLAAQGGLALTVQHEPGLLSMLLLQDGRPLFLRTKPLPGGVDGARMIPRECRIALSYVRDTLGCTGPVETVVWAEDPTSAEELRQWWASQDEVTVVAPDLLPAEASAAGTLPEGSELLEPVLAVVAGRFR